MFYHWEETASTFKMVKHTQTIRRLLSANCLSVFYHFMELVLKGLEIANSFIFHKGLQVFSWCYTFDRESRIISYSC